MEFGLNDMMGTWNDTLRAQLHRYMRVQKGLAKRGSRKVNSKSAEDGALEKESVARAKESTSAVEPPTPTQAETKPTEAAPALTVIPGGLDTRATTEAQVAPVAQVAIPEKKAA